MRWLSGLVLTAAFAAACTTTPHAPTPSAASPSPSVRPSVGATKLAAGGTVDAYAGRYEHCRALVRADTLAAPFWLDFTHFDPPGSSPVHAGAEVLSRYRSDPMTQGLRTKRVVVAFATMSRVDVKVRSRPVWIVVSYGVEAISTQSSTPMRTDQTVVYDDRTLRSLEVIQALPSRCR